MILIALVLLIAVGPEQLPGVIRRTGKVVGQFKTMTDNLRRDFSASLDEIERAADVKSWVGPELESTVEAVKEATVEPFRTDLSAVDGSTKVKDIWANPPKPDPSDDGIDDGNKAGKAEDTAAGGDGQEAGDDRPSDVAPPVEPADDADAGEVA